MCGGKEEEGEDKRKYDSWYSLNRIKLGLCGITWIVFEIFQVHSFGKSSQEPSELNSRC